MKEEPNPGSADAVAGGCNCPIIDNGHGYGSYKGGFIVNMNCPIHKNYK